MRRPQRTPHDFADVLNATARGGRAVRQLRHLEALEPPTDRLSVAAFDVGVGCRE